MKSLALILLVLAGSATAGTAVRAFSFTRAGRHYTLLRINPLEPADREEYQAAARLLAALQRWKYAEYRALYPDIPADEFEARANRSSLADGRTVAAVVLENEGVPGLNIRAMLSLAYRTPSQDLLPDEVTFDVRFPGREIRQEFFVSGGNLWHIPEEARVSEQTNAKVWDIWERATHFFKNGSLRTREYVGTTVGLGSLFNQGYEDFIPLLFHLVEGSGLASLGFRLPEGSWLGRHPVFPSEYLLSCHPRLVPLYQRWGFEAVPDLSDAHGNAYLRISRHAFRELGMTRLSLRRGYSLIRELLTGELRPTELHAGEAMTVSRLEELTGPLPPADAARPETARAALHSGCSALARLR